ncbi:MAG: hypothetical protein JO127_14035 [Caulobacteraceae bacterium]|nr:hypothetical protein [Caulobacteraceae bacterium]
MPDPVFIFMLTRHDRTVPEPLPLAREALEAGVRHIGFKDQGATPEVLAALVKTIREAGAASYLEVVSLDEASEVASAELALRLGVDNLLGGVRPRALAAMLGGRSLRYFPFAGRVASHPSVLLGAPDEIAASAAEIAALPHVDGLDLLAYRSDGDPAGIMRAVCAAIGKPVIVAGSIDRPDQVRALREAGAWGFTVGTAAIDGVFPANASALAAQLAAIETARRGWSRHPRE